MGIIKLLIGLLSSNRDDWFCSMPKKNLCMMWICAGQDIKPTFKFQMMSFGMRVRSKKSKNAKSKM